VEHVVEQIAFVVGTGIEAIAIAVIAIGVLQALVRLPGVMFGNRNEAAVATLWLGFARWLIAGLTFQLAADIVHTTVAPTWQEIGRVAAIAVIRTFLTFALERDLGEARARKSGTQERPVAEPARL
jgi:uncharacterized membrane protein